MFKLFKPHRNSDLIHGLQEKLQECEAKLAAIDENQATIEFSMDGTILTANKNFTDALGYDLAEIAGKHHRIFVDSAEASSEEYQEFWHTLKSGKFHSGRFRRIRKHGGEIWIQAMYYPLPGPDGRPYKVVKYASDISHQIEFEKNTAMVGDTVASSIEQMVLTINEISENVSQTAAQTTSTETEISENVTAVCELKQCSDTIENVVEIIRSLAEQTNLLALNATIESARAGEAGRGFAVVANEVKTLAEQTSKATHEISQTVSNIQQQVDRNVESTRNVSERIRAVAENMNSISAAVEEQSATMGTLSESASMLRQ